MNICQLKAMLLNAFSVETGRGGGGQPSVFAVIGVLGQFLLKLVGNL